ncbi:GIY-YIG nuclease family protein [Vibrio sp. ED002]|nr:GIY-YIG nuclease family protein [Vibrio sp. ED002]
MVKSFYVYVHIDPRNYEEFYYGKGKGSRKYAHLNEDSDTEKSKRIKAIRNEGLEPIIRVIARNLSEHDALLVEKTLLWKLGKQLTNISSGHYSDNFRPHDALHKKLSGFDFQNGLYYYNVGEGGHRNWDDYVKYGFISAGQAPRFKDAMLGFEVGDVFAAYLKGNGFVGIGRITGKAKPVRDVLINNVPLLQHQLTEPNISENSNDPDNSEYVASVDWIATVERNAAKWLPKSGLFTSQLVRASLDGQPETVQFLAKEFSVDFEQLLA